MAGTAGGAGETAPSTAVPSLEDVPSPSWFIQDTPQEGPESCFLPRTGGSLEKALKLGAFEGVDWALRSRESGCAGEHQAGIGHTCGQTAFRYQKAPFRLALWGQGARVAGAQRWPQAVPPR